MFINIVTLKLSINSTSNLMLQQFDKFPMSQYLKWILKVKNTFSVFKIKLFIHVKCLEIVVGEKVQFKQSFRWLGSFGKHF